MERNKINFVTGETYTLAELFSGNRRIVIPDLQRDYCWGNETNKKSTGETGELVADFISNLIGLYDNKVSGTLNLGLFYGYEVPANHIQLCDGQQRLTTLYLLLGMLNKKVGRFRQHLISDYEYLHDDKEPYLNYAIRESSLYFLSDLVCRFFIDNNDPVESIKKSDWYFNDYNYDPSICSMINALFKIESVLEDKEHDWLVAFGEWLLYKLTFLYFDMEDRKNGEETFVIINTTGEPLSATQNLKPLIIEENKETADVDKKWEQIETWFWQKREGDNDTADAGFAEFLRWISIIEQRDDKELIRQILKGEGKCEFPYKKVRFDTIYNYWLALKWIMESAEGKNPLFSFDDKILSPYVNANVNDRKAIDQTECFVLLPVLYFVYKYWPKIEPDDMQRNAKRVYEFFVNLRRIDNVSKSVNELIPSALHVVDVLKDDGDLVSILEAENISRQLLTEEEKCKFNIFKRFQNRVEIENSFWKIQQDFDPLWKGEIFQLVKWANNEQGDFDFDKFKQYVEVLKDLFPDFPDGAEHEEITDCLRRCMIVNQGDYYPVERGSYVTFGWEWKEWRELLCREGSKTKEMFDYIIDKQDGRDVKDILSNYIEENIGKLTEKNKFVEFAKDNYLLSFTHSSEACDMCWGWDDNDWKICYGGGTSRHTSFLSMKNACILKAFGGNHENQCGKKLSLPSFAGWSIGYGGDSKGNCIVFEDLDLKLDVRFLTEANGGLNAGGTLKVALKTLDGNRDIAIDFPAVLKVLNLPVETGERILSEEFETFDVENIKHKIEELLSKIDQTKIDQTFERGNDALS